MDLPRDEMAFRKRYEKLLLEQEITTVFRPGTRVYPNRRGYMLGETVIARVIERCGSDALGVPPVFNEMRIPIMISSLTVKMLDDFRDDDFEGSSPDVFDRDSLETHLVKIYRTPIESFGGAVTRIQFRYIEENLAVGPGAGRSEAIALASGPGNRAHRTPASPPCFITA